MGPIGFYAGKFKLPLFAHSLFLLVTSPPADLPSLLFISGVVPYVTMDGLSGAIKFATYEWGKKLVAPILPPALHAYSHFVCAAGAFISCSVVMVPGELLKQRLQVGRVGGVM